jgi:branched-subunit amino acid aminotransferase/4-amino-4-deoxychorismate lyase
LNRPVLAIVDGTVLPAAEATVPVTDEGLLRGDGVFELFVSLARKLP